MKKIKVLAILAFATSTLTAQWKPAGDKIKTKWASQIDVNNVLPEYPRPIMERDAWQNLNGLWEYSIQKKGAAAPKSFDGEIFKVGTCIILWPSEKNLLIRSSESKSGLVINIFIFF